MSSPVTQQESGPIAAFIERHETLRAVIEWIADRFADEAVPDTEIGWEDGEDHDEPQGPISA